MRVLVVVLFSLFFFSFHVRKNIGTNTEEALQNQIKMLVTECATVKDQIYARNLSNPSATPYYQLAERLNTLVFNEIDTSFKNTGVFDDTIALRKSFYHLITCFNQVIDSTKEKEKYPLFLKDDEVRVRLKSFAVNEFFATSPQLNYYYSLQKMLFQYLQSLNVMRHCYQDYSDGYDMLLKIGRNTYVYQTGNETHLALSFNSGRAANYKITKKIKIENEVEKKISFTLSEIKNDTAFILIKNLPEGKYKAIIKYNVYRTQSEKEIQEIEFPFVIK